MPSAEKDKATLLVPWATLGAHQRGEADLNTELGVGHLERGHLDRRDLGALGVGVVHRPARAMESQACGEWPRSGRPTLVPIAANSSRAAQRLPGARRDERLRQRRWLWRHSVRERTRDCGRKSRTARRPPIDDGVGAENPVASCDLHVFVDEAAEPVSS